MIRQTIRVSLALLAIGCHKPVSNAIAPDDSPLLALISDWMVDNREFGDAPDFLLYRSGRVIYVGPQGGASFHTVVLTPGEVAALLDSLRIPSSFDSIPRFYDATPGATDQTVYTVIYWAGETPRYVGFRGGMWSSAYGRRHMPPIYVLWHDTLEKFTRAGAQPWQPPTRGVFPGQAAWQKRPFGF